MWRAVIEEVLAGPAYRQLVLLAASVVGPDDAEDVVGDVLLYVLEHEPPARSPLAYIRSAVRRRAAGLCRKAREVSLPNTLAVGGLEDAVEARVLIGQLAARSGRARRLLRSGRL